MALSITGTLARCTFLLVRIPSLTLHCLTVPADMGFLSDGSVKLWFSSEGGLFKPPDALKPKGIASDWGLFSPYVIMGKNIFEGEADGKPNPTLSSLQVSTLPISGGSTTQPVCATEAAHGHHEESFTC